MSAHHRRACGIVWVALALLACKVDIQHGLDEVEANHILVTLERAGVPSVKDREEGRPPTWKVRVPSSEAARAWQILRDHELPRGRTKGFEVFGKGALIPSQTEERALYQQAMSGEIARMLQAYPGVVDARVLVSLSRARPMAADAAAPKTRASVLIKFKPEGDVAFRSEDVQRLVAGAVPGLDAKDVAVVATPLRQTAGATSEMSALGPFVVSAGTQSSLQIALVAGLAVIVLLSIVVVVGVLALRRTRARLRALERLSKADAE